MNEVEAWRQRQHVKQVQTELERRQRLDQQRQAMVVARTRARAMQFDLLSDAVRVEGFDEGSACSMAWRLLIDEWRYLVQNGVLAKNDAAGFCLAFAHEYAHFLAPSCNEPPKRPDAAPEEPAPVILEP